MNTTQWFGIAAGVMTAVSMLPQLIKIIKEKKADDVSVLMLMVLIIGLGLWVVYGFLREDWPLIVTNSFSFLLNLVVLMLRIRFSGIK